VRTAKHLDLRFVGTEEVSRVHGGDTAYLTAPVKLELPGQTAWSARLLALDLRAESRAVGRTIDGLIGMDFMAGRVVRIDYRAQFLEFGAGATRREGMVVPMQMHQGNPCISVAVDGSHTLPKVRVDTGCNQALHWSPAAGRAGEDTRERRTIGSWSKRTRTQKSDIAIASRRIENVATTRHPHPIFPGEHGLLGNPLLARFGVVTLDFARGRLILGGS